MTSFLLHNLTTFSVQGNKVVISVYLDGDELGHSVVITSLPPSLQCSNISFPGHTCRSLKTGVEQNLACVCILHPEFPVQIRIPVLPAESCPLIEGYECSKLGSTRCACVQLFDEADDGNTGFCLEYKNHF